MNYIKNIFNNIKNYIPSITVGILKFKTDLQIIIVSIKILN